MKSIDLITQDVTALGTFLRDVAPVRAEHEDPAFSCYRSEDLEIMLSPSALVPMSPLGGVILHFEVADLDSALARAHQAGHEPCWGPEKTDWGTRSALLRGPDGVVVDLFTPLADR